jgi:hypothetical protein
MGKKGKILVSTCRRKKRSLLQCKRLGPVSGDDWNGRPTKKIIKNGF